MNFKIFFKFFTIEDYFYGIDIPTGVTLEFPQDKSRSFFRNKFKYCLQKKHDIVKFCSFERLTFENEDPFMFPIAKLLDDRNENSYIYSIPGLYMGETRSLLQIYGFFSQNFKYYLTYAYNCDTDDYDFTLLDKVKI